MSYEDQTPDKKSDKTKSTRRSMHDRIFYLIMLALLSGIIFLLAFTPLGYLRIGVLSISFLSIPVAVGAIMLGPLASTILGAMFGITSLIQALTTDPFGLFLMNENAFLTVVCLLLPRILMGLLTGLIFRALKNIDKTKLVSYSVASISASLLNSVLFLSSLLIFFSGSETVTNFLANGETGFKNAIITFVIVPALVNVAVEAAAALVLGTAISKALVKAKNSLLKV